MILLLEIVAALAIVFGVAALFTGHAQGMPDVRPDLADTGIPRDRPMTPDDVVGLRFALAFRGYRMDEVDDALDRLSAEIAARDEAIARLSARPEAPPRPVPDRPPVWSTPPVVAPPPVTEPVVAPPVFTPPVIWEHAAPEPAAEPEPVAEPEPEPEPAPEPEPVANPYRPQVPDLAPPPAYDPWSVTPQSRYTEGPTHLEVDEPDEQDVDALTTHQTGYQPLPAADDDDQDDPQ